MASFEMGATLETMTNIEALTTPLPPPLAPPPRYPVQKTAASGRVYNRGFLIGRWIFSILRSAQLTQLRVFCPGKSATVYIKTLAADDTYRVYSAVMILPDEEDRQPAVRDRLEYQVTFTQMVEIEVEE
jgi:hypothetical protein